LLMFLSSVWCFFEHVWSLITFYISPTWNDRAPKWPAESEIKRQPTGCWLICFCQNVFSLVDVSRIECNWYCCFLDLMQFATKDNNVDIMWWSIMSMRFFSKP
jgi:hypothetical protein